MSELMQIVSLKQRIETEHADNPQRLKLAQIALGHIAEALKDLEALGHRIVLAIAPPDEPVEFPKMVYGERGAERIVANEAEEAEAKKAGFGPLAGSESKPSGESPPPPSTADRDAPTMAKPLPAQKGHSQRGAQ